MIMKRKSSVCGLAIAMLGALICIGCNVHEEGSESDATPKSTSKTDMTKQNAVDNLTHDADLVITGEKTSDFGGSKYSWVNVKVIKVLKNTSGVDMEPSTELKVAYYSSKPGPPPGQSTLFLTPYQKGAPEIGWRLLGTKDEKENIVDCRIEEKEE